MNLPSSLPWWIVFLGALIAIGVGKLSFGGLGGNIFNPALVGRVFLLIAYPAQMTLWPQPGQYLSYTDAVTSATPLGIAKGIQASTPGMSWEQLPSTSDLLFGLHGGSLGEVSAIALLLGLAFLLYRKVITWHIPVSLLGTAFIFSALMHWVDPTLYPTPLFQLLTGGMLLGAIFMATDYVTSPKLTKGQILFGIGCGVITMAIRLWGNYPEGVSFSILLMNICTPLINRWSYKSYVKGGAK